MQNQKKSKQDEPPAMPCAKPKVIVHARPMDKQQEQRLSTAVDALLAEWVRQQMGRAQQQ